MKKALLIIIFVSGYFPCYPQLPSNSDSGFLSRVNNYKRRLANATEDSTRIFIMKALNFNYESENPDSSLKYGLMALDLSRRTKNIKQEASTLIIMSGVLRQQGRFAEALDNLFQGRKLEEQLGNTKEIARAYRRIAVIYSDLEDFPKALENILQALILDETMPDNLTSIVLNHMFTAGIYERLDMPDSALSHANFALKHRKEHPEFIQSVYLPLGNVYFKKKEYQQALSYYDTGLVVSINHTDYPVATDYANQIAELYSDLHQRDSSLYYAKLAFQYGQKVAYKKGIMVSGMKLADLYDSTEPAFALKYLRTANEARDKLYGLNSTQAFQSLIAREEKRRKETEAAAIDYRNRIRWYALLSGLIVLLVIAYILYRNNKQKQKVNERLKLQKEDLQNTLQQLRDTQSQLIQSEKMASLGQLTSGIAHEIQNPLNFVNNFSELNEELIDDACQEMRDGNTGAAIDLMEALKTNAHKILQHGKRADAIVKSMLQHSRSGNGQIKPTNLNELAAQYFKIALQSLQSKDKSFKPSVQMEFDAGIKTIDVVPEDIGIVLVNLYNNAFQTTIEKKKQSKDGYTPALTLFTRRAPGKVIITVEDNGEGIPPENANKIFQPFFTTRPTGQGTGLGLSLSYDIITKGYQGDLSFESKEGGGSKFIISLPAKK